MVNWTKEQEQAIYTAGSDMLVAAAAGSGKTAVLVERIIQKLINKENPVDIDTLLVVTFTNAAAQEMRNRVGLALEKALAEDPASAHLKKQLSLLQRASISTLHSFCLDVVRQYAYLLDVDPAFRIANDMEIDLIKQDVIADLFEEWYGKEGEEQAQFFDVVDRFSSDRSDVEVENLVLDLYTFAMQNPWPVKWLDELADVYDVKEAVDEEELEWLTIIKREVRGQLTAIEQEAKSALELTENPEGPYQYAEAIEADIAMIWEAKANSETWDDLQAYISGSSFKALSRKKMECSEEIKDKVKKLRDSYKKRWKDMKDGWFTRNLANHMEDMHELAPVIKQLTEVVKEFKERFAQQKKEKAIVDFSDLEHHCLALLVDNDSGNENPLPSNVARHFKQKFTEVLVDEYQDTNLVQETILGLISDREGNGNMFMVGDVKQSIYRFRHAEPSLFIHKYKQFHDPNDPGQRIDLSSNFRSREQVLIGANYLFRQILDESLGEINYDRDAELIYANKSYDSFPYESPEPELLIIDRETDEETEADTDEENFADLEKAQLEARAYARKIREWTGQDGARPLQVFDKSTGTVRNFQYRDVVILMRSMTWTPTIVDELKKQGIPVYAELATGYFEAIEIKVMLSLLKVIDNPRQDIPLASVLHSPIVAMNEEELASIRLADKSHGYYDALLAYKKQHTNDLAEKATKFLNLLESFRIASRQGALSELIWSIYRETGYYDFVGGMPGGRQRQANLRALYDRARGYETTSFRGLFRFLRFIERMEERGEDLGAARALSEQEDVIRIMTIHKSKGLEFPVVILGGVDKQFNMQDLKQRYLLHKDLGLASKYIDPIKRITYPTLLYYAFQKEKQRELLAEEMRVLYVALTRAKEKLVMVGNVASYEKKQKKWEKVLDHPEWVMPEHFRMEAKSYLDWVGPALIRHQSSEVLRAEDVNEVVNNEVRMDPSNWSISIMHGSELANLEDVVNKEDINLKENIQQWEALELRNADLDAEVDEKLSYEYPYTQAAASRAKQTVTEIKRQRELKDEYSSDQLVQTSRAPIVKRPLFMQKNKTITPAEKGTAMHTVMQHIPLMKTWTKAEVERFAERLVDKEILTADEAEIIDGRVIEEFFKTEIGALMLNASEVSREVPFSLALSAKEVYATWTSDVDEQVLVQGVIDCVIPVEDGVLIVDYKTDAIQKEVTDEVMEQLKERYRTQMDLYRQAIERIWKKPVKSVYLYYFSKELLVEVPK
ncbi:helicase-exonuclease AddAB subunit AddA [Virgibacillus phasianinus]|uniref:ATP-dependent helicase/nuclease subunit A n=1 Tax=Virgibacillus phasianinus TaxID=2017483 RepID=A0A220TYG0_9BACI|nr:helicase-exonuclease AddAB subunit AddA [Virgibacillus phasianinus]ASK60837.1 helicase-exonuclease AddAB subunit AddA [Virgibacillus phasianinus]